MWVPQSQLRRCTTRIYNPNATIRTQSMDSSQPVSFLELESPSGTQSSSIAGYNDSVVVPAYLQTQHLISWPISLLSWPGNSNPRTPMMFEGTSHSFLAACPLLHGVSRLRFSKNTALEVRSNWMAPVKQKRAFRRSEISRVYV